MLDPMGSPRVSYRQPGPDMRVQPYHPTKVAWHQHVLMQQAHGPRSPAMFSRLSNEAQWQASMQREWHNQSSVAHSEWARTTNPFMRQSSSYREYWPSSDVHNAISARVHAAMTDVPHAQNTQYQRSSPVYMDNRHSFPPSSQAQSSASAAYPTPRGYDDSSSPHNVASGSFEGDDARAVSTGQTTASPEVRSKGGQTDLRRQPENFSNDTDHSAKMSMSAPAAEGKKEPLCTRRAFYYGPCLTFRCERTAKTRSAERYYRTS